MSVKLGNINFEGPYLITSWDPPHISAVYAIMIKPDPQNQPDKYELIYIDEYANLTDKGRYRTHPKFSCWIFQTESEYNIYIGINKMPNSTSEERKKIKSALINQYDPICND